MKTYQLKIIWPDSKPITTSCKYANPTAARKWMQLCLDICGKNEHGAKFSNAILAVNVHTTHK